MAKKKTKDAGPGICDKCGAVIGPTKGRCERCLLDWRIGYLDAPWQQLEREFLAGKELSDSQIKKIQAGRNTPRLKNHDRDEYATGLARSEIVWEEILKDVNRKFPRAKLHNVQSVRSAVIAHIERHKLPPLQKRPAGRRAK